MTEEQLVLLERFIDLIIDRRTQTVDTQALQDIELELEYLRKELSHD